VRNEMVPVVARRAMEEAMQTGRLRSGIDVTGDDGRPFRLTAAPVTNELGHVTAGVLLVEERREPGACVRPSEIAGGIKLADHLTTWAARKAPR
jgi:hypothetical protein